MADRCETRTFRIRRGRYVVEVEVEIVCPEDDPTEACLEPKTSKFLDEVARHAEAEDLDYLRKVGRVCQEWEASA